MIALCKIYIARPCQYTTSTICEEKYVQMEKSWFNSKIIDSFNEALDSLKRVFKS